MTEIGILNIINFNNGYILKLGESILVGTTYYLRISGNISIDKQYIPITTGNIIIDSWGSQIPSDGNICYTLTDSIPTCSALLCSLVVT